MRMLTPHLLVLATACAAPPTWRDLPPREPDGVEGHTGAYVIGKRQETDWEPPPFHYDPDVATGRKACKVVVLVYDPVLESEGKTLRELVGGVDPVQMSHVLADVVREASWGYVNYEIVDVITVDGFPEKVDGFRYDDAGYLAARESGEWQPATSSYRGILEENGLVRRCNEENVREVWLWGADGMHFDEFAMYVPRRYARYGPTDNVWLYRPYDLPGALEHTTFVMGFNYMVGADNMLHSYGHRAESMLALAVGDGVWDPARRRDPWNVFTWLEMDHEGTPSMAGNVHVPPNGEKGYDYANPRRVPSWSDRWHRYPDLRGPTRQVGRDDWGHTHFGYMQWWLQRMPKFPGHTGHGYDNWWVYVANPDMDLPEWEGAAVDRFVLPDDFPPADRSPR